MNTQESYNVWFREMVSKYLSNHEVVISENIHNEIKYILATIKHPEDIDKNIEISTYGREITLFFWSNHSHHDTDEDDDHEEEFKDLTEYINDILNDDVYFSCTYNGDNVTSSMSSYKIGDHIKSKEKTIIKTWSGLHDQTINMG